jgi:lipopolysaccharide/colanic/teichoic acid biosynthesis glycosyltransferase
VTWQRVPSDVWDPADGTAAALRVVHDRSGTASSVQTGRGPSTRLFDLIVAGLATVVLAPVMAAVAVAVRCTSRGPVLFRQVRIGHRGRPFVMLKFRTMFRDCDDRPHRDYVLQLLTDPSGSARGADRLYKLVDDPRVTRLGRWLRETSLDELPQLINVLRGEMSVVGPRPALPWEAARFNPHHARRFEVRPGITGLWQTSGRNMLTMTEALDLDVEYVRRRSLRLDVAILLRTVPVVLRREGVR